jgi:hypothetical protein
MALFASYDGAALAYRRAGAGRPLVSAVAEPAEVAQVVGGPPGPTGQADRLVPQQLGDVSRVGQAQPRPRRPGFTSPERTLTRKPSSVVRRRS